MGVSNFGRILFSLSTATIIFESFAVGEVTSFLSYNFERDCIEVILRKGTKMRGAKSSKFRQLGHNSPNTTSEFCKFPFSEVMLFRATI